MKSKLSEPPIAIYVFLEGGLPFYSLKLTNINQQDDLLFAGFLEAISSFAKNSFGDKYEKNLIKSLKQKINAILLESTSFFTVVSVVKIETYDQRRKLEKLTRRLFEEEKLNSNKVIDQGEIKKYIEPIVYSIFELNKIT